MPVSPPPYPFRRHSGTSVSWLSAHWAISMIKFNTINLSIFPLIYGFYYSGLCFDASTYTAEKEMVVSFAQWRYRNQ
ncbi:hypothetical protein ANTRET_LOCUS2773 [Anthophora retusa]